MKRYIVTAYTPNSKVNKKAFNTLKLIAKKKKAELLVFCVGHNYKKDIGIVDKEVLPYIAPLGFKFNEKLSVCNIATGINILDPLTGMDSVSSVNGSMIVPANRHRTKLVARSLKHSTTPRGMFCTGTISEPYYKTTKTAFKVADFHLYGGLLVEVKTKKEFNVRQLEFKGNCIYDLTSKYTSTKEVKNIPLEGISLGDVHPPFINPAVLEETLELLKKTKVKSVFLHDLFDACSVSHHAEGKFLTQSVIAHAYPNLEAEVQLTADTLADIQKAQPKAKLYVVKSNHDEHLDRYLDECRFKGDRANLIYALELAKVKAMKDLGLSEVGALEYALNQKSSKISKVKFLDRRDILTIAGIECSNHGDYGANGSRGNAKQHGLAFTGKIVTGHIHTPEIGVYGNYVNGTMTYLSMPYTNDSGTSGWLNTHTMIYANGARSQYNIII